MKALEFRGLFMYNSKSISMEEIFKMDDKINVVDYLPFEERTPDYQYLNLLRTIKEQGIEAKSFHAEGSITFMAPNPLRYDLRNGIPLGTERSMKQIGMSAVAEILAFVRGMMTQEELVAFGVSPRFWGDFVTADKCKVFGLPPGNLGPGSYGGAFAHFPTSEGKEINQFKNVIAQIRRMPDLRTHFISPWIPQYAMAGENSERKVVVATCHGWVHIRILNGELHLQMTQRAGDVPIGVPSNIFQYAVLTLILAHVLDMKASHYYHAFSDAHIYNNQLDAVDEILQREPVAFPSVYLRHDTPKDLFEIEPQHVIVEDYHPNPPIKGIPVAI
jgi:thymidylate synthase